MRIPWLLCSLGCALSPIERVDCETDQSCRDAFGLGSVCGDEGYCNQIELHPRCTTTPSDLFEAPEDNQDTIVLGHLWRNQSFDIEQRAVELAVVHVNEEQGLDGRPYGLVSCDTESLPDVDELDGEAATIELAGYLAETLALPAIIGATSSPETQAAYTVTGAANTLLISPSSTSPALTSLDGIECSDTGPGLLWRTVPPDELQGQVIAYDLSARSIERVTVIYEEGSYGEGLTEAIDQAFAGDEDLFTRIAFADSSEIASVTEEAIAEDLPEEVVFITSSVDSVSSFLSAAAELHPYMGMGIFLADAAYNQEIYDALADSKAEELFDQIRGTRPTIDMESDVLDAFKAEYESQFDGEDPTTSGFSAYAYDAAWLAIYGSAWAHYREDGLNGLNMARGLRRISEGDEVSIQRISWNEVRAAFMVGSSVDIVGASGQLDYNLQDCETSAPIEIWNLSQEDNWVLTTVEIVE